MEVAKAIKERRSIRRLKRKEIPREITMRVLEAIRWAPSWANTQCWEVIIVQDEEKRRALGDTLPPKNPARSAFEEAPLVVVFVAKREVSGYYKGAPVTDKGDWYMFDVALAVQNLCLSAHNEGLGTVIVGYFDASRVARLLEVEDDRSVVAMVPMGYPEEVPQAPPRKEIEEFVRWVR